jgi:hypothetical protein
MDTFLSFTRRRLAWSTTVVTYVTAAEQTNQAKEDNNFIAVFVIMTCALIVGKSPI